MLMKSLTNIQAAAAELVDRVVRDSGRAAEVVVGEYCAAGGALARNFTVWELMWAYRKWKRASMRAATWNQSPEDPVDPVTMETFAAVEETAEEESTGADSARSGREVAGALLRLMDQRLLKAEVKWKETEIALRAGDEVRSMNGPGRVQTADGKWVEWLYCAVVLWSAGGIRKVVPESVVLSKRGPGKCPHGSLRLRVFTITESGKVDAAGTMQAVGTMLLMFRGEAAGMRTHAEVARATGKTRANGSAKARRIAAEVVRAGNKPSFSVLRARDTVGKKKQD